MAGEGAGVAFPMAVGSFSCTDGGVQAVSTTPIMMPNATSGSRRAGRGEGGGKSGAGFGFTRSQISR